MFLIMLILFISLIIVVFALQNSLVVPIVFFNWSSQVPLVIIIFVSVLAGAMIIFCLALWKELRNKFNKISTNATNYKNKLEVRKDAFSQKLKKFKTVKRDSSDDQTTPAANKDGTSSGADAVSTENSNQPGA